MNFPELIEHALKETFREFARKPVPVQWLRSSQVQADYTNMDVSRIFPQVLFTSSSKYGESEDCTYAVTAEISCITWFEDDRDCSLRAKMYEDAEFIADALGQDGRIARFFSEIVRDEQPQFLLGGITLQETTPETIDGVQIMAARFNIHFSM